MGLDSLVFQAYHVKLALTSIANNVRHTPRPSLPVSPALLKRVVHVTRKSPEGDSVAVHLF